MAVRYVRCVRDTCEVGELCEKCVYIVRDIVHEVLEVCVRCVWDVGEVWAVYEECVKCQMYVNYTLM